MRNNKISSLGLALTTLLASSGMSIDALNSNANQIQPKVGITSSSLSQDLIIQPSNRTNQIATHYSHQSHQSHSSHSSHSSHYSSGW